MYRRVRRQYWMIRRTRLNKRIRYWPAAYSRRMSSLDNINLGATNNTGQIPEGSSGRHRWKLYGFFLDHQIAWKGWATNRRISPRRSFSTWKAKVLKTHNKKTLHRMPILATPRRRHLTRLYGTTRSGAGAKKKKRAAIIGYRRTASGMRKIQLYPIYNHRLNKRANN